MKQTAVQWFATQIMDNWNDITAGTRNIAEFIEQAKEMEKQQIMDAFEQQIIQWVPELLEDGTLKVSNVIKCSKQYYIENYGGDK